jgi:hypothetical protein
MNSTPTPIDANTKMTLTLEAQHWNFIMQVLNDTPTPYRVSSTLIPLMMEQLQTQVGQAAGAGRAEGNGHDAHPPAQFEELRRPLS